MNILLILATALLSIATGVQGWKLISMHEDSHWISIPEFIVEWLVFAGLLVGNVAAWVLFGGAA